MVDRPAQADFRGSDVVGMMSTAVGVIGAAFVLWGQLYGRARDLHHGIIGHPVVFDALSEAAKVP